MAEKDNFELTQFAAKIVANYVSKNKVTPADLPELINQVHIALSTLGGDSIVPAATPLVPAVALKKSVGPDYIICLEDGLKFKTLKRHLNLKYNMTPDQYRSRWSLPPDYPMVAPSYAEKRSALAKSSGLGRMTAKRRGVRAKR